MSTSQNLRTVLGILKDEVDGDVAAALARMTADYSMTWMYRGREGLFPRSKPDLEGEMRDIYPIKGRSYEIKNVAEGEDIVMVELIERYPNSETGKAHETPLVLVLEMKEGRIQKGRHYCDPKLSHEDLPPASLEEAYAGTTTKQMIQ